MQGIAVIGYGYWGPNIVRNLNKLKINITYVVDVDENRCKEVERAYPGIKTTISAQQAINDPDTTAVIIVLPAKLHYPVAIQALSAGKHVLIEKPITSNLDDAKKLEFFAKDKNLTLMVDHTYLYSPAVQKIKDIINTNNAVIKHISSNRSNLGMFRKDVNVLWDLAPHDLSIIQYLSEQSPKSLAAFGSCHNDYGVEDEAHLSINYSTFTASVITSWISPEKIRLMEIITDKFIIVFNDLEKESKISVYDAGFKTIMGRVTHWNNGVKKINCTEEEPLSKMIEDFVKSVDTNSTPVSNSSIGVEVVKILEASDRSLKNNNILLDVIE